MRDKVGFRGLRFRVERRAPGDVAVSTQDGAVIAVLSPGDSQRFDGPDFVGFKLTVKNVQGMAEIEVTA